MHNSSILIEKSKSNPLCNSLLQYKFACVISGTCQLLYCVYYSLNIIHVFTDYRHKPKPAHSGSNKFSESNILNEIERLHNKDLHNHPVHHKDQNTDLETGLHDYTKQKPASHRSTSTSTSDDKARKKETDPPFHEWRKFIDNNPKYGKANLATEKPTAKPTTFHHWREFIDNNPKYTKPPVKTKNTRKPTPKTTLKLITHHVITKTKPAVTGEITDTL